MFQIEVLHPNGKSAAVLRNVSITLVSTYLLFVKVLLFSNAPLYVYIPLGCFCCNNFYYGIQQFRMFYKLILVILQILWYISLTT